MRAYCAPAWMRHCSSQSLVPYFTNKHAAAAPLVLFTNFEVESRVNSAPTCLPLPFNIVNPLT